MKLKARNLIAALGVAATGLVSTAANAALDLRGETYGTYGDANSYSLAVSAFIYNEIHGGGVGPGNPFYVDSTPGSIKDFVVIATGAGGTDVNTNLPGMQDAMHTPNGGAGENFFSGVWHSTLSAFLGYLDGQMPLFMFNNNQTNSGTSADQTLAAWAQIRLEGAGKDTIYFDLSNYNPTINDGGKYAIITTPGAGGVINGDPTVYTSAGAGPDAGNVNSTDYVFSGGEICLTAAFAPVSCTDPTKVYGPINNNLGANQAVYALDVPELNQLILSGGLAGYTDFYMDLRLGCDPAAGTEGSINCLSRDLNNGYEQVFMVRNPVRIPEPGSLVLLLAASGLMFARRRR